MVSKLLNNRYLLQSELGQGRTGMAYRALDQRTGRTVAVKILNSRAIPGGKSISHLQEELNRRWQLNHPNIVQLLGHESYIDPSGEEGYLIIQEFIEGVSLRERIAKLHREPLSKRTVLEFIMQVAGALEYLHLKDIAITNLNPKHIFLTAEETIKLPAFGYISTAQWLRDASRFSQASGIDHRYIAPETIEDFGIRAGDTKADMYLFGILAFELASGIVPFDANRETLLQLHKSDPVPDTLLHCAWGSWYNELVCNCLEKLPEKRLSPADVLHTISQHLERDTTLSDCPTYIEQYDIQVLFVEDNKLDQLSFARSAKSERYPFQYKIAHSVTKAKELLSKRSFDVVVSDFMLPDGTGVDVVKAAKDTPTIVVTGAGREDVVSASLKAGAFDYISKEMDRRHLKELPRAVLRAHTFANTLKHKKRLEQQMLELEKELHTRAVSNQLIDTVHDLLFLSEEYLHQAQASLHQIGASSEYLDTLQLLWRNARTVLNNSATSEKSSLEEITVPTPISQIVAEVVTFINQDHAPHAKHIKVSGCDELMMVQISHDRFRQALLHLLLHMQDTTPNITIRCYRIGNLHSSTPDDQWIRIAVESTNQSTLGQQQGAVTPIGLHAPLRLAIVDDIVRKSGGFTSVEQTNFGTVIFQISLPEYAAHSDTAAQLGVKNISFNSIETISNSAGVLFLGESDEQIKTRLQQILTAKGLHITSVPPSLLDAAAFETCDLLLLNENFPEANKIIERASRLDKQIPIIQYCKNIPNLPADCFRQIGRNKFFVAKPLSAEQMLRVITYCLTNREELCLSSVQ